MKATAKSKQDRNDITVPINADLRKLLDSLKLTKGEPDSITIGRILDNHMKLEEWWNE